MTNDQVRRVIGYVRVSRDEQVRSGLGLQAQEQAIERACAARGWVLLEVIREEGVSGATPWQERPGLSRGIAFLSPSQPRSRSKSALPPDTAPIVEVATGGPALEKLASTLTVGIDMTGKVDPRFSAMARKNQGGWRAQAKRSYAGTGRENRQIRRADALVVAKLDRLSRSVLDFSSMAEKARLEGWNLVILDPDFDMSTPTGELLVGMLAQFAQFERRLIGQRTREALAAKKASGWKPGRPTETSDLQNALIWDLRRGIEGKRQGLTLMEIKNELDALTVTTPDLWAPPRGRRWAIDTIRRVIRDMPTTITDPKTGATLTSYR
jgi:DNA invertase Pin-like site-specific DNA recombinase